MSQEGTVRTGLQIRKGSLSYSSQPTGFICNVTTANPIGPTPGAFTVSVHETDVDLSKLTALGGLCRIQNLDPTNFVEWGIKNSATGVFYPLGEMLPGESYVLRLSRNLLKEEPGTGSPITTSGTTTFTFRAHGNPCICLVECFDP